MTEQHTVCREARKWMDVHAIHPRGARSNRSHVMTNPDRDELVKLEAERAELIAKNEAATSWGAAVGARSERIKELDGRIAALRRLASSDGGVKVKPLVWRDHRPDSFPEPAWSAQTPFGFYNIEEVSASDSPAYVVRLHAHHFVADKDSLDDAKAAAQADYEARIKSALVEVPAAAGMREALEQINAHWSEPFSHD